MTSPPVRTAADFAAWAERSARGLVFLGMDPHYGIGLDTLVAGYRIACLDLPPAVEILRGRGVSMFSLAEAEDRTTAVRGTAALAAHPLVAAFVGRAAATPVLVFKTSHALEAACAARGWRLLAAPAAIARRWENKTAFLRRAVERSWPVPPGSVVDAATATYDRLAAQLGPQYVLQAPYGYGGRKTHLVSDPASHAAAREALRARELRATSFVPGRAYTLNACVTARGIAVGAPCAQLTGLTLLTPGALGSCGNDWSHAPRDHALVGQLEQVARQVGDALREDGFLGVFGVDFVHGHDGRAYLIEVNPRLVASIALSAQLELLDGRLPLLARHVLAHVEPDADDAPLDQHAGPLAGGQAIVYHLGPSAAAILAGPRTGVLDLSGGTGDGVSVKRPEVRVDGLSAASEALVLGPAPGRVVARGGELLRLQVRGAVADAAGALDPAIGEAVGALRSAVALSAAGSWSTPADE